jgi:hypothetical protein
MPGPRRAEPSPWGPARGARNNGATGRRRPKAAPNRHSLLPAQGLEAERPAGAAVPCSSRRFVRSAQGEVARPPSEQEDRADAGILAVREGPEHDTSAAVEFREGRRCRREGATVPAGVGNQKDQVVDAPVALLQAEASLERLDVVQNRLGLDGNAPPLRRDDGIPGSEISVHLNRHLGPPGQPRVQAQPKALKETLLARVSNWVAVWIGTEPELHPNGREHRGEQPEVRIPDATTLRPAGRRPGNPARGSDLVEAETG